MKNDRVESLHLILKSHPEGIRKSELARRLGVHRSTIGRYIEQLGEDFSVSEEDSLVRLANNVKEQDFKLDLYETLALTSACENVYANSDYQNPYLAKALRKLANGAQKSELAVRTITDLAESMEKSGQNAEIRIAGYYEMLCDSMSMGRVVAVSYLRGSEVQKCLLGVYVVYYTDAEGGKGLTYSVMGRDVKTDKQVVIPLNKIKELTLTEQSYEKPEEYRNTRKQSKLDVYNSYVDTIPLVIAVHQLSTLNAFKSFAKTEPKIEKISENNYRCSFAAENTMDLILRIIRCYDAVEILGPSHLRIRFVAILRQILSVYGR